MAIYYVKSTGGAGSGLDDANAWNYAKFNATTLIAGDTVLFKKGNTFYGIFSPRGGTNGNPITYSAYGTGSNPVFTGFTELTSWTLHNGTIYYATLDMPNNLHIIVTLDGTTAVQGRYPNTGWLTYESHTSNTSITDSSLTSISNWTGAEVVIRKYRWIIDRHPIISHSGNTITYSSNYDYGNSNAYQPVDGNGYFIQGHLDTLDSLGDWYYDNANNRLYMHFGTGTPSGKVVKAVTTERNLTINSISHIVFNDMDFEGALIGAYHVGIQSGGSVTYNNCNWRHHGDAIYGIDYSGITLVGGSISNARNNALFAEYNVNNTTIDGVGFINSGIVAGAGRSGDISQSAIQISGNNAIVRNCSVVNNGYVGIGFRGSDILIENNFVDTTGIVKDDGAGIYTVISTQGQTEHNRIIRNNIVLNAIGAYDGAGAYSYEAFGKTAGIYVDDYSNDVEVSGNVVAHGEWGGIFINGQGTSNKVLNNTVYDFADQLLIHTNAPTSRMRGLMVTGNTFIAKTTSQHAMYIRMYVNDNPGLFGTFNNNIYARPIDDSQTIVVQREYTGGGIENLSLANWKTTYSQDSTSVASGVATNNVSNMRFEYNNTISNRTISLSSIYKDVENNVYSTSIVLAPFTGIILISQGNSSGTIRLLIHSGKLLKNGNKLLRTN